MKYVIILTATLLTSSSTFAMKGEEENKSGSTLQAAFNTASRFEQWKHFFKSVEQEINNAKNKEDIKNIQNFLDKNKATFTDPHLKDLYNKIFEKATEKYTELNKMEIFTKLTEGPGEVNQGCKKINEECKKYEISDIPEEVLRAEILKGRNLNLDEIKQLSKQWYKLSKGLTDKVIIKTIPSVEQFDNYDWSRVEELSFPEDFCLNKTKISKIDEYYRAKRILAILQKLTNLKVLDLTNLSSDVVDSFISELTQKLKKNPSQKIPSLMLPISYELDKGNYMRLQALKNNIAALKFTGMHPEKGREYTGRLLRKLGNGLSSLAFSRGMSKTLQETFEKSVNNNKLINLRLLTLKNCGPLTNKGLHFLKKLPNLESLEISWECGFALVNDLVDDESIKVINELTTLKSLTLGLRKITGSTLDFSKMENLESVDFTMCLDLQDSVFKKLVSLPKLKTLRAINLQDVTDEALTSIGNIQTLELLDLRGCNKITDDGLDRLKSLKNLKLLDLRGCKDVTKEKIEDLRKSYPELTVLYEGRKAW